MIQEVVLPTEHWQMYMGGFIAFSVLVMSGGDRGKTLGMGYLLMTFVCQTWLQWVVLSVFLIMAVLYDTFSTLAR